MADTSVRPSDLRLLLRELPVLTGSAPTTAADNFPAGPVEVFSTWLHEAVRLGVPEPHAMTLATTAADGGPDTRVLLLKDVDERGWHFAIDADSPKGRQLQETPRAALNFYWPSLTRQVRVRGPVRQLPAAEAAADFLARPEQSRINALASLQSERMDGPGQLSERLSAARSTVTADPDHVLPSWHLYTVEPVSVELWQGSPDRNHVRIRYSRTSAQDAWRKERLWP